MSLLQTILQRVNDLTNAFNKMQTDSKLTSELPVASTPISGEELVRIVQNGTSKKVNASFIGGGTGGIDYDDSWIQPEIDTKVEFKGAWVNASYNKNDWITYGPWMGVAKVDTTELFPPQESGNPSWLLPTAPTWEDLTLVGDIYYGIEFYGVQFNTLDGFRVWSNGVATESFRLFAYEVSDSEAATFLDFVDLGSNLPAGWNVVSLDQFGVLVPSQKYRLIVEVASETNTTNLSDNWDYVISEDTPTAGEIGQTVDGLYINQISGNATDQSAFLDQLEVDDTILMSEAGDTDRYSSYRITGILAKVGSVYNFEVILSAQGKEVRDARELDVSFTHKGVPVSTNYHRIQNYWSAIPDLEPGQVRGFVTQDPDTAISPVPGFDDNAYGVDLFFQTYVLSDDWFYIAVGEAATNNSGGGTDIEIVDNLTTQDSTKALSANQGYVLDQKIDTVEATIPDASDFMTKAAYAPNDPNKVDAAFDSDTLGGELPAVYNQSAHAADSNIHLSTAERASIEAMATPPSGSEPFALLSQTGTTFTQDEQDAIKNADAPDGTNTFVTQDELVASGAGNMHTDTYDTTVNGIVDNSEQLGGQPPSYYLDWDNVTNPPVDVQVVTVPGNYTTANKDADKKKALDVTGGASSTVTLDSTGLLLGFEQQAVNGGSVPFSVAVAAGDTVLSPHATQVSPGYFAYYLLLRANTWSVAIGEIEGQGSGDMTKDIYDTTDNGIVDNAEKLGGKTPSQYGQLSVNNQWQADQTFLGAFTFGQGGAMGSDSTNFQIVSASNQNILLIASGAGLINFQTFSGIAAYFDTGGNLNANQGVNIQGDLEVHTNPSSGVEVGNRDYNDGRYAGVALDNTFTGDNSFSGITSLQETHSLYHLGLFGDTTLTDAFLSTTTAVEGLGNPVTITIPQGLAVSGQGRIDMYFMQESSEQFTIVGASGVTLEKMASNTYTSKEQFAMVQVTRIGPDHWLVRGDLETV